MLRPVTKKWEDRSTLDRFGFVFFCDCCQKAISSPEYKFDCGFRIRPGMTRSEERARELIWQRDHEAAYERANLYMMSNRLHICEICGASICGDCVWVCEELDGGVCCDACLHQRAYHGTKIWRGE